jgi:uncharacterized protein with FMN-binding domain
MKRIVTWLLSTITIVVLLFGYHTSTSGPGTTTSQTAIVADNPSTPSASSSPSTKSSSTASTKAATSTGSVAQTRWGPVQVKVTVSAGKITNVSVVQYPSGNPKDQQINAYALPILVKDTIDAQSANIDMISGATVTSQGYLQSLQSALDGAGL